MADSFVQYSASGSTDTFTVTFPFISRDDVSVAVDGVDDPTFTWTSDTIVVLSSTPTAGQIVDIRRSTPSTNAAVDFSDGSVLSENALDTNTQQLLYIGQEQLDAATVSLKVGLSGHYEGASVRITDIADPVADQDVVTKAFLDASQSAQLSVINAAVASTAADVVLTNADVVSTNADVLLTNADVVSTNADVVTTNADVVLTNADVVLTGLDVVAAAASAATAVAAVNGGRTYVDKSTSFSLGVTGGGFQGSFAVTAAAALDISLDGSYTPAEGDWFEIKDIADTFGTYPVRLVLDNTEFYDPDGDTFSHVKLDFKETLSLRGTSYFFVYEAAKWRYL